VIQEAALYSDALQTNCFDLLPQIFHEVPFHADTMIRALMDRIEANGEEEMMIMRDLCALIQSKVL